MGKYKEKCNAAARKVVAPVLEWLEEQHSEKQYDTYFTSASCHDGPTFFTSTVYQKESGFRRVFPRKIAHVTQFMGSNSRAGMRSYDENVLPQEKLVELMKSVDVQDVYKKEVPPRPESSLMKFLLRKYDETSRT